jgi:hypothetical protein
MHVKGKDDWFDKIAIGFPEFEVTGIVDGEEVKYTYRAKDEDEAKGAFIREFIEYTKPEFRAKNIEIKSVVSVERDSYGLRKESAL